MPVAARDRGAEAEAVAVAGSLPVHAVWAHEVALPRLAGARAVVAAADPHQPEGANRQIVAQRVARAIPSSRPVSPVRTSLRAGGARALRVAAAAGALLTRAAGR